MAGKPVFLQLEKGDDAPSVRDRLSFIHGKSVLLIWPEEGTVLTRKLDLVLVQREAMRRAIRLALVTHDVQVVQHATELNISTFETIGASERARWKRGRARVFARRSQKPVDTPDAEELMPVASRVRGDDSGEPGIGRRLVRIVVLLLLLAVTAAAAYVAIPSATVTIAPAQSQIQAELTISADLTAPDLDIERGVIPATRLSVTVEETSTVPTTGAQALADIPAQGSVIFVNQTETAVEIPVGTTLSTSAGTPILFRTTEDALVPAGIGQQLEAPIEALQGSAGEIGNVESGLINTVIGALAEDVTVRNLNPTFGGTSRSLAAVSVEDRDRLLATVRQQLQSRAYVEMLPRLDETQFLILETVRIAEERSDWTTFSAQPGEPADSLTLTMRAVVEATSINERFGQQIVFARLAQQIPRGREVQPESITYERGPVQSVYENGNVDFSMTGTGQVMGQINTAMVQQRLAGQSVTEALAYLAAALDLAPGVEPRVELNPDWFGQMPLLPIRISVQLASP